MSSNVDTSGYQSDRYFARSWALLTKDKGWWKPVLICAVASLVPIVGPIAVLGYALEWSRRVAWGSSDGPARSVKVGELIRSGWRGLVVIVGWSIAQVLISSVLGAVPYLGDLLSFVWGVVGLLLGMAFMAAAVRATIYQDFKAGYRAKTLYEMVAEDPWGLMRIWLIQLVTYVIDVVLALVIFIPTLVSSLSWIVRLVDYIDNYGYGSYYGYYGGDVSYLLDIIGAIIGHFAPALLLFLVIAVVVSVFTKLLMYAGIGLWMRRFDVERWGRDEDPLPDRVIAQKAASSAPVEPETAIVSVETVASAPVEPEEAVAPVEPEEADAPAEKVASAAPVKPVVTTEPIAESTADSAAEPAQEEEPPVSGADDYDGADYDDDDDCDDDDGDDADDGDADDGDTAGEELISVEPIAVAPIEVPPAPEPTNSDISSH